MYSDETLTVLAGSGDIRIHNSLGYPVAEYKNVNLSLGIEPLNPLIRRDLSLGYVVVLRNTENRQDINNTLDKSLPSALSIFKNHICSYEAGNSKMR
ncbi:hypothetical protein OGW22_11545 [Citrobacter sp. Cb034]|nr:MULTISPECIES: hypothetical protein [Citrobacter]MDM3431137.1 hypothetical protein [Citrobacter sp. Cb023]MDM3435222.1 hypothetical protein [Citrobacter sp. Cb034]WFO45744.1 hypothetical protein MJ613_16465 [Citrobacter braakii]